MCFDSQAVVLSYAVLALQRESAQDDLQGFCACSENWAPGKDGVGSQGSSPAFTEAEFTVRPICEQLQTGSASISIIQACMLLVTT